MAYNGPWGSAFAKITLTAATADQSVIAAVAGKAIVVDAMWVSNAVAVGSVFFESATGTAISGTHTMGIGENVFISEPILRTAAGEALTATTAGATSVIALTIRYHLEG